MRRERPILFSGAMVRAILAGRKNQTRRVVKLREFKPTDTPGYDWIFRDRRALWNDYTSADLVASKHNPYGKPGDRLWVRETWRCFGGREYEYQREPGSIVFRADLDNVLGDGAGWRPSIFMPRWASRITLEVTGVRVERLHAITEEDARAEGVDSCDGEYDAAELCRIAKMAGSSHEDARGWFAWLWCQINGAESWDANPWVWVVEFQRVEERAA